MENAPKTFAELMKGRRWTIIRQLFRRNDVTLSVSTSEEAMGQFSEVILDGEGFRIRTGRGGLQAAFTGSNNFQYRPITSAEEVLEKVLEFDDSLNEIEILAEIIAKIDGLMSGTVHKKVV